MTFAEAGHPEEKLNLVQLFFDRVCRYGKRQALLFKDKTTGQYQPISWNEWGRSVKMTALGLHGMGVRKGDRVGILSENRPEWTYADLGILSLGAASVPIYPTSSCQDVEYIVENAGIEILFISTLAQFEKIRPLIEKPGKLRWGVILDQTGFLHEKVISMSDLCERGRCESFNNPELFQQLSNIVDSENLATIIYTSGTTGPPKGVMLTHHNFVANYLACCDRIQIDDRDIALSFLPLSHIFERLAGYYYMVFHGATVAYAESMQTVPEDILLIRPTIAASVPRLYEKMYARILENVQSGSKGVQRLFSWALEIGRKTGQKRMKKQPLDFSLSLQYKLAKIFVFNKIRKKLGGRIRFFISGGAPLAEQLAEFFYAADVLILEGYGLTETSPVMTVNSPSDFRFGTVGRALSNVQIKIAEDGEILTRGPCVMKGYYQNEAATQEAMRDGWFHTGDIGFFDSDGFLKITDRKKDIIVTSGGKKFSPQNIEGLVLGDPLFSQIVVIGDRRNYLVALIVPNRQEVEKKAREFKLDTLSWETILSEPRIYDWIEGRLRERLKNLAAYEQIKYFALLPVELTQTNGELTPTLKVKRKVVMEKFQQVIDGLYQKGIRASAGQSPGSTPVKI